MRTRWSTGTKRQKESEAYEFYTPTYEKPVVIQNDASNTYTLCNIPRRYHDMSFKWLREHGTFPKENEKAYKIIKEYADNIEYNISRGLGLILRGPAGTGKTSIAVSILKEALKHGKGCYMLSMPSLLDTLLTLSKGPSDVYMSYENKIRNVPLLLLDDFGAEYGKSEWVAAKVDDIIIDRYNRMKPIIMTTNYSRDWTSNTYSMRVSDRLRGEYLDVVLKGESHR